MAFSYNSKFIALGSWDSSTSILVYEIKNTGIMLPFPIDKLGLQINSITFDSTGQFLATASSNGMINIFQHTNNKFKIYKKFKAGKKDIQSIAFSPNNEVLILGGYDEKVCLWDINQENCISEIKSFLFRINAIHCHSSGLVSISSDNDVTLWEIINDQNSYNIRLYRRMSLAPTLNCNGLIFDKRTTENGISKVTDSLLRQYGAKCIGSV